MATAFPSLSVSRWLAPETIARSFVVLLFVTVVQRGIGFVRGALFAHLLPPAELGLWDMTYGFVALAAPLAVLGLPACFNRYVPRYQQQGRLVSFLKRTTRVAVTVGLAVCLAAGLADRALATLIYGDASLAPLGRLAALCLAALILFDVAQAIFQGLRLFRVVSLMQAVQNLGFAALGTLLLVAAEPSAAWAAVGFAAVTFAVTLAAMGLLRSGLPADADPTAAEPAAAFWRRMLTYAFWVWVANGLLGLFQYVDRLLLLHLSGQEHQAVLEQLGVYSVMRLIALLVLSLAGVLSSVLVPHLGHFWEAGQRDRVRHLLGATIKIAALASLAAAVVLLAFKGFLLNVVFGGKYSSGAPVLPAALAFSVFAGLYALADPYLLCVEKVWLSAVARLAALAVNVGLNVAMIPRYGLYGAALAGALSMAAGTLVLLLVSRTQGWRYDPGLVLLTLLPLVLLAGLGPAAAMLAAAAWIAWRHGWLVTGPEKALIAEQGHRLLGRFGMRLRE